MKHIDILKFAVDFNSARGRGSKNKKARFYESLFAQQVHLHEHFTSLSEKETTVLIKQQYLDEYKQWKRKNEIVVTARNRILKLYNLVSSVSFCMRFTHAS